MNFNIFRKYDIRGIVGKDLDENNIFVIAKAFACMVIKKGGKKVCISYDGRQSSPAFSQSFIKGLVESGLDVVDLGIGPSPYMYFADQELDADAGVMITASHNPPEYNGVKMIVGHSSVVGDEIDTDLVNLIKNQDFVDGTGSVEKLDLIEKYLEKLLKALNLNKELNVVWDNGNGAGGQVIERLLPHLPGKHTLMYGEIDPTFPNHHPDPSKHENLKHLQDKVKELNADIGLAFDGDADRLGVVTNKGRIISNDILLAILANEELKNKPGSVIVGDVKCSKVFFDKVAEWGGVPKMVQTGAALIKKQMPQLNAVLAGEISGHIIFRECGYDDGIFAAIKMLNVLNNTDKTIDEILAEYPTTYVTEETRIAVPEKDKWPIVAKITEILKANPDFEVIDIDGARATSDDGIIMFRASNTENLLSIRCESLKSEENLKKLLEYLISELVKLDVNISMSDFF